MGGDACWGPSYHVDIEEAEHVGVPVLVAVVGKIFGGVNAVD